LGLPPAVHRKRFAFLRWPGADRKGFEELIGSFRPRSDTDVSLAIEGSDVSSDEIAVAERNASRAGVAGSVSLRVEDFFTQPGSDAQSRRPGVIITNPPYGERIDVGDAGEFYRQLGDTLKRRFAGWTAWILCANAAAMKQLGLRVSARLPVFNGGLESRLYRVDLYRGSGSAGSGSQS
jgi:putative N6-adenine-specific DNA methylase